MKIALLVTASLFLSSVASAACFGTSSLQTCSDDSGNDYTISRFGNTTIMNGSNSNTGSAWSQQSTTFGSTTFHNGIDKDGDSWSSSCFKGTCN